MYANVATTTITTTDKEEIISNYLAELSSRLDECSCSRSRSSSHSSRIYDNSNNDNDDEFFDIDLKTKLELIIAADYLELSSLVREACFDVDKCHVCHQNMSLSVQSTSLHVEKFVNLFRSHLSKVSWSWHCIALLV